MTKSTAKLHLMEYLWTGKRYVVIEPERAGEHFARVMAWLRGEIAER